MMNVNIGADEDQWTNEHPSSPANNKAVLQSQSIPADNYTNIPGKTASSPVMITPPPLHKYVLSDSEIEQSLQELDDTVASLEGGVAGEKHNTSSASLTPSTYPRSVSSSRRQRSDIYTSFHPTTDETSSISSIVTERSHAVLMHRHLIDNMETVKDQKKNVNPLSPSLHTRKRSSGGCSRKSSSSRRSKMTQKSSATNRSRQRGPSLERVIFQTLLHVARSDSVDVHFLTKTDSTDGNASTSTTTTESILKDLIQADAILSVEIGSCLPSNFLLPPIFTDDEESSDQPVVLSSHGTTTGSSTNNITKQAQSLCIIDDEWKPDFDAIVFPSTVTGSKNNQSDSTENDVNTSRNTSPVQISSQHQQRQATTATTTATSSSSQLLSHVSSSIILLDNDSPGTDSDIFDQIDDNISFHGNGSTENSRHDTEFNRASEGNTPLHSTTDFLFDNIDTKPFHDNNSNTRNEYKSQTLSNGSVASWGFPVETTINTDVICYDPFISSPVKQTSKISQSPIDFPTTIPTNPSTGDDSIYFPTELHAIPTTTITTGTTTKQYQNDKSEFDLSSNQNTGSDFDQWMSFDANPFQAKQDHMNNLINSPNHIASHHHQEQPMTRNYENDDDLLNSPCFSNNFSYDNVSVSSPSSVVAFTQIVDRLPTNKSDDDTDSNQHGHHHRHYHRRWNGSDTKCSF